VWKRIKKVVGGGNEQKVKQAKQELAELVKLEQEGEIELYYGDASGFSQVPTVPYAWQPVKESIKVPSKSAQRLNVYGLLSRQGRLCSFTFQGTLTANFLVAFFEPFSLSLQRTTVVVLDNASVHRATVFTQARIRWASRGLFFYFLPPYSPQLNLIENLWRHIKYRWLSFSAYHNFSSLKNEIDSILEGYGSKYLLCHG